MARSLPSGARMNCTLLLAACLAVIAFAIPSSFVDVAAMPHRMNQDGVTIEREQNAPVADAQSHAADAIERLSNGEPVLPKAASLLSICDRVATGNLRHWRNAADVKAISFTP